MTWVGKEMAVKTLEKSKMLDNKENLSMLIKPFATVPMTFQPKFKTTKSIASAQHTYPMMFFFPLKRKIFLEDMSPSSSQIAFINQRYNYHLSKPGRSPR